MRCERIPILALDMYEHAYHIDFGANVGAYVDTYMRNIDWKGVAARYQDASKVEPLPELVQKEFGDLPAVSVEEVKGMIDPGQRIQFIDARPKHYVTRTQDIIDGATGATRSGSRNGRWSHRRTIPSSSSACMGSTSAARRPGALREAGFDAKYMKGGHSAWRAIGGPVKLNQ